MGSHWFKKLFCTRLHWRTEEGRWDRFPLENEVESLGSRLLFFPLKKKKGKSLSGGVSSSRRDWGKISLRRAFHTRGDLFSVTAYASVSCVWRDVRVNVTTEWKRTIMKDPNQWQVQKNPTKRCYYSLYFWHVGNYSFKKKKLSPNLVWGAISKSQTKSSAKSVTLIIKYLEMRELSVG